MNPLIKMPNDTRKRRLLALKGHLTLSDIELLVNHIGKSQSLVYNYLNGNGNDYSKEVAIIEAGEKLLKARK